MSELLERKRKSLIIAALVLTVDDEDNQRKKENGQTSGYRSEGSIPILVYCVNFI